MLEHLLPSQKQSFPHEDELIEMSLQGSEFGMQVNPSHTHPYFIEGSLKFIKSNMNKIIHKQVEKQGRVHASTFIKNITTIINFERRTANFPIIKTFIINPVKMVRLYY
jgi:hypothetical protein